MTIDELHTILTHAQARGFGDCPVRCWQPFGIVWMDVTIARVNESEDAFLIDGRWDLDLEPPEECKCQNES